MKSILLLLASAFWFFLIRALLVALIYALPFGLAGFIEWSTLPGAWSIWSRLFVGVAWVTITVIGVGTLANALPQRINSIRKGAIG